jgi:hypothetical protein
MHHCAKAVLGVVAVLTGACVVGGCGASDVLPPMARYTEPTTCPAAPDLEDAGTLVVLVWDGGLSRQLGDRLLNAFDAADLPFTDDALEDPDLNERFRLAVLDRVQLILCDLDPLDVAVVSSDAESFPAATIVHMTGDAPANDARHIGQSDFDPCNARGDDAAVIWGGALASRMPPLDFDRWVNVVANTTAHEIGHTLGFVHPSEETVARLLPIPSVEIMRANVKPSELAAEQYFLVEQQTCPGYAPGDGSYALTGEMAVLLDE